MPTPNLAAPPQAPSWFDEQSGSGGSAPYDLGQIEQQFMALVAGKPPTKETLDALRPQLTQMGITLVPNADGSKYDLMLPDGRFIDAVYAFGGPESQRRWQWLDDGYPGGQMTGGTQGVDVHNATPEDFERWKQESGYGAGQWNGEYFDAWWNKQFNPGAGSISDPNAPESRGRSPIPPMVPGSQSGSSYGPTGDTLGGLGFDKGSALAPFTGQFRAPSAEDALNSPGLLFALGRGQQALERSAASRGTLLTGGLLRDLGDQQIGMALQGYNDVYNRSRSEFDLGRDIFESNQDRPFGKLMDLAALGRPA